MHASRTLKSSVIFGLIFVLVSTTLKGDHNACKTTHFSIICSIMDIELTPVKNRRLICEGEDIENRCYTYRRD